MGDLDHRRDARSRPPGLPNLKPASAGDPDELLVDELVRAETAELAPEA